MSHETRPGSEPAGLNPANDRRTPYTDCELDGLTADWSAMTGDTAAWRRLVAKVGAHEAAAVLKQRLAARDPRSLINLEPAGKRH